MRITRTSKRSNERKLLHPGNLPLVFTIAAFPTLVFAWRRSLDTIFFAISADDLHRTLYAWEVTQGRLIPSDLWPPLQFWIEALALVLYPRILCVPYLVNTITQANPTRLMVVHAALLAPFAALALQRATERQRSTVWCVAALVAALAFTRLATVPAYPNGLPDDTAQVGKHIHQLRAAGQLDSGERIMVEVVFWDYVMLRVLTGDPSAVVYDRPPIGAHTLDDAVNPSALALPPEELRAELARQRVRLVVAYSERATRHLRPIAHETLKIGRFHVFLLRRAVESTRRLRKVEH
jgi:hypothetical protein